MGSPSFCKLPIFRTACFPDSSARTMSGDRYDLLASEYHRPPVECRETFEPVLLRQEEARLLGVRPRSAGMRLERLTRSADGVAIELSRGVLRGDRCRLTVDLR